MTTSTTTPKEILYEKKVVVKNHYISNIAEEFIAMQVGLEWVFYTVISILKELDVPKGDKDEEKELTVVNHRTCLFQIRKYNEAREELFELTASHNYDT